MESTIDSMCRCCAAEGIFKDIKTSYHWMGEEEVYGDMLRECFDVKLASIDQGGICEVCITQLRNAANFKKQVVHTERKFKRHLDSRSFKPTEVKEELSGDNANSSDDDHVGGADSEDDEDYVPEFEIPIKTESPEESKSRKRAAKASASTSRAKKSRAADEDKSDRRAKKKRKLAIKKEIEEKKPVEKLLLIKKHLPEMKKQWHNLTTILMHSNATPFKDRTDAGYICAYCYESYPSPSVLRAHTHRDHVDEKRSYKAGSALNNFIAYLDIVDLKCTICDHPKPDLKTLIEHLVAAHQKQYFFGETDYFIPYKLPDNQQMNCCICGDSFHNMKLLMQHMNVHYRNFICTTCGAGFVNSFRLLRHETTHEKKKSSFPCKQCGAVFPADSKRKAHINTEHKGIAGDSVCRICKARFKNYYQKTRHMVQVHNAEGVKCEVCEKRFNLKSNLISHMRNVHLKERPFECSVCNMGFFIKRQMLYHYMATHTNERNFKCDVCGKAYATQCSKRKHMKKNHGLASKTRGRKSTVSTSSRKSKDKSTDKSKADGAIKTRETKGDAKNSKATTKVDDARKIKDAEKVDGGKNNKVSKEAVITKSSKESKKVDDSKQNKVTTKVADAKDRKDVKKVDSKKLKVTTKTVDPKKSKESKKVDDAKNSKQTKKVDDGKTSKASKKVGDANKKNEKAEIIDLSKHKEKELIKGDDVIEIQEDVSKTSKQKKSKSKKKSRKDAGEIETHDDDNSKSCKKKKSKSKEKMKYADLINLLDQVPECDITETRKKVVDDDDVIVLPAPKMGKTGRVAKYVEGFEIHTRAQKDDDFYAIQLTEFEKHLHNIRTLLMHSNATPIQNHNEAGFSCGYCVDQFLTAAELKFHTLENHGDDIKRFKGGHTMFSYVVKLDITSLRCVLCTRKIFTLELLMEHLETKHDIEFHKDIKNQILPFKFQSDIFSCVICDRRFDRFQQMQWHMSVHYRNFECDHCQAAFINKSTLSTHLHRHQIGVFKCRFCTKVYDTKGKKSVHEKYVHIQTHKRNKCTYCDEFFMRYPKKLQHMVEVHGHKPRVVKCNACDKTFETKEKLSMHNKRDHMMERNHKCEICEKCFFHNYDLTRHLRSHMTAKPFICEVCNKGFNRKDNLLEHSRTHTGENIRFSCDRCGLNFRYMARLRRHTADRHKDET